MGSFSSNQVSFLLFCSLIFFDTVSLICISFFSTRIINHRSTRYLHRSNDIYYFVEPDFLRSGFFSSHL